MPTTGNYINAHDRGNDGHQSAFGAFADIIFQRSEEQRKLQMAEQASQQEFQQNLTNAQKMLQLMNVAHDTTGQDKSSIAKAQALIESPAYGSKVISSKNTTPPPNAMMSLINGGYGDVQGNPMQSLTETAQAAIPQPEVQPAVEMSEPQYRLDMKFGEGGKVIPTVKDMAEEIDSLKSKAAEYGIDASGMSKSQIIKAIAQKNSQFNGSVPDGYEIIGYDQRGKPMVRAIKETVQDKKFALDLEDRDRANKANSEMVTQSAQDMLSTISEVEKGIGNFGLTGSLPSIPGTSRANWEANVNKLTASKVLNLIQSMKEASKTGATGFGALSEKELRVLQDASTALNRNLSPKDAQKYIDQIKELSQKVLSEKSSQAEGEVDSEYERYLQAIGAK